MPLSLHLPKGIHDALFEDETPAAPEVSAPQASPEAAPSVSVPSGVPVETISHDDDAYQKILARTDTASSPVFATLKKYLDPLASSPIDEKTKFGIALKQAQALDGLDASAITGAFEQAKATLQDLSQKFDASVATKQHNEVETVNARAADLQAQAKALVEQAFAAQQSIDQIKHRFQIAVQTRSNELDQEAAKYASLIS